MLGIETSSGMNEWTKILGDIGQFLFGLVATILAIYATIMKRKELFRTSLQKQQFDEVVATRNALQELFFDIYYVPSIKQTMEVMKWNIDNLKHYDSDSWEQYQRYRKNSLDLFYKLRNEKYYLWPKWVDKERLSNFWEIMKDYAPFTLVSTSSMSKVNRDQYMNEITKLMEHLDESLAEHA